MKKSDFLGVIFTMEKTQVKIIFGRKMFICEAILEIFVAPFRTFGMKKNDAIIFLNLFLRTKWYAKTQFPEDVRRVGR